MYNKINNLAQDLIIHTKAYDSHPCADMIRNSLYDICEPARAIRSQGRRVPNNKFRTRADFVIRDDST